MSNETEQRFLLREIENLKQRLERLEVQEKSIVIWKSWTPTLTGWSGTPTIIARYTILGKICFFWIFVSGTSNSSVAYLTLPVTASNITNGAWGGANLRADNNGTTLTAASRWIIPADNPTIIRFNTNMSSGAWDTSGIKRIQVIGFYEMA